MNLRNRAGALVVLFLLALAVRVCAAVYLDAFHHPQIYEYDQIARAMLAGKGFTHPYLGITYYSYAPPLYVWLCAAIYFMGGTVATVLVAQMVASALHVVIVAVLAEELFHRPMAGLAAGLLMAVHPGLIVYASGKLHPLTFDALFFTVVFWQFWRLRDHPSIGRAVLTGITVGVGAHSRATTVVFLPIGLAWLLWTSARERWGLFTGRWLIAAVCAGVILVPWAVRNSLIHHQFVWSVSVDNDVFWRGNNPNATGHSYVVGHQIVLDTLTPDERRDLYLQPNEMAQSRWFHDRAMAFIQANPGTFVALTAKKFFYFWWFSAQTGVEYAGGWLRAYKAYYVGVIALALVGLWRVLAGPDVEAGQRAVLLVGFLLSLSGLQSLYYVEGRHRWAIEPLVIVLSAGGVASFVARPHAPVR
jgi:4-amino-4-deoxy-L-arabinose transferase-like glycosyltransferase